MVDLKLKDNEQKYLEFILKDADGNRIDLTGYTPTINIQKYGENTLILSGSLEVTNASDGECRYFYNASLDEGDYKGEIEAYDGSTIKYITPTFTLKVIGDLPD